MKLLVLAQIPPPLHGQSQMVQTLVAGLPARGISLHHVPLNLSQDHADIGRWRIGKVFTLLGACLRAVAARFSQHCDTLYYVPAPGKRAALYRDWLVMLLCRPFFPKLVLHFHNGGLDEWLKTRASFVERQLTRALLGRADLAIVLTESLQTDAQALIARDIAIVPNGIEDPAPDFTTAPVNSTSPFRVLFLGLCSADKGLFDAMQAVLFANQQAGATRFHLTVAGSFPDKETQARFEEIALAQPDAIRYAGFVQGAAKRALLQESQWLCLPTRYPHEGQPLVLLEALAYDLPIIATRWRGIPDTLPADCALAEPGNVDSLIAALRQSAAQLLDRGVMRNHFLQHFTVERHLTALAAALARVSD